MSKRLLSLISVLFLVGLLSISCSNSDKTGSSKGLSHYAGTWIFQETTTVEAGSGTIIIGEDSSVNLKELNLNSNNVTDKGNETYDIVFTSTEGTLTLTLKFTNETNGDYEAKLPDGTQHIGTLTKQQ